jgi:hypothetical protein
VLEFLAGCPAAISTQRVRVTAIDHHHDATGLCATWPISSGVSGSRSTRPGTVPADSVDRGRGRFGDAVPSLARLANGMFGRRGRCLLVLSQLAGIPYRNLRDPHRLATSPSRAASHHQHRGQDLVDPADQRSGRVGRARSACWTAQTRVLVVVKRC